MLSGDTIIIRQQPKGGPPPEKTIGLTNVTAPRLARRPQNPESGEPDPKDEVRIWFSCYFNNQKYNRSRDVFQPFAWEAREFARKKIIGKEICYIPEYSTNSGKDFGYVYCGRDPTAENLTELMLAEGLLELKRGSLKADS